MVEIVQVLEIAGPNGEPTGKFRRTVKSDESDAPPRGLCSHEHDSREEAATCPDAKHWGDRRRKKTSVTVDLDEAVNRFLGWRFPDNFNPDGGISFKRPPYGMPTGTNLLDFTQAKEMLRYVLGAVDGGE